MDHGGLALRGALLFALLLISGTLASEPADLGPEELMTIAEASKSADKAVDTAKAAQLEAARGEASIKVVFATSPPSPPPRVDTT